MSTKINYVDYLCQKYDISIEIVSMHVFLWDTDLESSILFFSLYHHKNVGYK